MKREMPILFAVSCERTKLFSLKCELAPSSLTHSLLQCSIVIIIVIDSSKESS